MEQEIKTNKLSIYLLKNNNDIESVLKKTNYKKEEMDDSIFYYDSSYQYEPKWKQNFFNSKLENVDLFNKGSKGVYFLKILVDSESFTFAIPFGYGHSMIDKTKLVDNFGLKLVLNLVDRKSIRKISKRTLSSDPKNTIEQLSKIGNISDFSIDVEQDLVEEITGKPKEENIEIFGKNLITGRVAFSISKKVDIENIEDFLKKCIEYYKKENYKEDFAFIDYIKEIKDTGNLNNKLIEEIKKDEKDTKLWIAVPEIIEWEDISGFSFSGKNENLKNDIYIDDFKETLSEQQKDNMSLDFLKKSKAICFKSSDDKELNSWSIFQCMYCEIDDGDKKFILTNGKWYEIAKDFVSEIEKSYEDIMESSKNEKLLDADNNDYEDAYNKKLSESIENAILMDKKNISYGGGHSSIEFCDVYDKDKKAFIHVKNYYGSSALSHLFAQGKVSGQLFLNDKKFRKKVIEKESRLNFINNNDFELKNHKIIFGIISKSEEKLNLPFFSKVNLKSELNLLKAFGFKEIYLVKIQRK